MVLLSYGDRKLTFEKNLPYPILLFLDIAQIVIFKDMKDPETQFSLLVRTVEEFLKFFFNFLAHVVIPIVI